MPISSFCKVSCDNSPLNSKKAVLGLNSASQAKRIETDVFYAFREQWEQLHPSEKSEQWQLSLILHNLLATAWCWQHFLIFLIYLFLICNLSTLLNIPCFSFAQ